MLGILRTEACNRKCSTTVAFGTEAAVVLVGDGRPQSASSRRRLSLPEWPLLVAEVWLVAPARCITQEGDSTKLSRCSRPRFGNYHESRTECPAPAVPAVQLSSSPQSISDRNTHQALRTRRACLNWLLKQRQRFVKQSLRCKAG